jgi:hypothetical protein
MKIFNTLRTIIVESTSFEELYKKYVEPKKDKEGKKIKPIMDKGIFVQVLMADPTTKVPEGFDQTDLSDENLKNIKPGIYRNWLLKSYEKPAFDAETAANAQFGTPSYERAIKDARSLFLEDLFKTTDDLKFFTKYKQYLPQDKRDINKFTPNSLFLFLQSFELPENIKKKLEKTELKKEVRKSREGFNHPGSEVVFEGPTYTVIKIDKSKGKLAQEAASWFGGFYDYNNGESRWCTSPPDASYTMGYLKDGPLYVVMANDDKGKVGKRTGLPQERFQFHFPSNQFMDRLDQRIELVQFLNGPASELKEFFKPEFAKGMSTGDGTRFEVDYPSSTVSKFIALYGFDDLFKALPESLTFFVFNNKSNEKLDLKIPVEITKLKKLEAVMFQNCLSEVPEYLAQIKTLQFASFPQNPDLKSIPDAFADLPNLHFINLQGSPNAKLGPKTAEKFKDPDGKRFFVLPPKQR